MDIRGAVGAMGPGHGHQPHPCSQLLSKGVCFAKGESNFQNRRSVDTSQGNGSFIPGVYLPERQTQGLGFAVGLRAERVF